MANLSDIVTVDIDIASPAVDSNSFDNLIIVGPAPRIKPSSLPPDVGVYSSLSEVNETGWDSVGSETDPVGVAAMVAFSQSPQPSKIYIAVQKLLDPLISNTRVEIITEDNYLELMPNAGETPPASLPLLQVTFSQVDLTGGELSIMVQKDGVMVHGENIKKLTANEEAMYQIPLSAMEIVDPEIFDLSGYNGTYSITLEAELYSQFTNIGHSIHFDGFFSDEIEIIASEQELEHPTATLARALTTPGWYVICPAGIPVSQYEEIAQWTEAQEKMFAYSYSTDEPPVGKVYYRSFGIYGKENPAQDVDDIPPANFYSHVAFTAKCLSYEAGSETWAFKSLSSVYPSSLSSTLMNKLKEDNINYYTTYASKDITQNGKVMAGEWIDVIRFRDWLKNDMQLRIFNLMVVNPKLPYTNSGIGLVENQMIASLKSGTTRGGIAEDEFDEDDNLIPGFVVTVPNSASLTDSQKASRILTGCKFKARIAGAIHAVEVKGSLTYSL